MKMVKKILLGLTAAAVIFGLAGCKREEAGNADLITINGASSQGSIAYTNNGNTVTRGFKSLNQNHLDALCKIEMSTTGFVSNGQKAAGSMGYIFDIKKNNSANTYDFTIAAVRYNQENASEKKVEAYVETFKNVPAANLENELTGGIPATGKVGNTTIADYGTNYGFTLVNTSNLSNVINSSTNNIDIWIDVVANDGTSDGRNPTGAEAGSYSVRFFKADPERSNNGYEVSYQNATNNLLAELKVENTNTSIDPSSHIRNWQSDMGCYANVYEGQSLTGKWKFSQIKLEAEEIEE